MPPADGSTAAQPWSHAIDTPSAQPDPDRSPTPAREDGVSSSEVSYATWMHLAPLLGFFVVGPFSGLITFVIWQSRRDRSRFEDDHGREAVNMSITGALVVLIGLSGIGLLIAIPWCVITFVSIIRAANAAGRREYFRYPIIIRVLN